jgi:hypothetical protein
MRGAGLVAVLLAQLSWFPGTQAQVPTTYSTDFRANESPISEGGRWINGKAAGLDWNDVWTRSGMAFGGDTSGRPHYDDPTAVLTGNWGPNQTVQAKVRTRNQDSDHVYQEVELRLRTRIAPHWNAGYEVLFRCTHDGSQYVEIVRWNGRLGDFTYLARARGPGLYDGDVVRATIIGDVITAHVNGTFVTRAADATFTSGNPGMGFYLDGARERNVDYGYTFFSASDGALPWSPSSLWIVPLVPPDPNELTRR